ncbi:MAG: hypothetical protein WA086_02090 [Ideonella sp.]
MNAPTRDGSKLIEPAALIPRLASDEMTPLADASRAQQTGDAANFLSTAAAAKILGMSRPYVTMLCDSGKLPDPQSRPPISMT